MTRVVSSSLWALLVLLPLLAPSAQGQPLPAASLDLCLAAAADGSCVYPTRVFRSPTTAVVVVYQVPKGESQQLTARLTIVDVGGAFPANAVISKQDMRPGDLGRGILTFMGPPLPTGKYRVDVTAGGKPWKSVEFAVTAAGTAPDITRPEDVLPLATGKAWTYTLVQEAGKSGKGVPPGPTPGIGEKVGLSGIAPDADGKFRATVTLTAASTDQAGTRIETRRAGALVFEEWSRLDERGWTATQRKDPLGIAVLDPPQAFLPRSLTTPQEWTYEPSDPNFHFHLGDAYLHLRRHKEAVGAFKEAINLKPNDVEARFQLGRAYLRLGDRKAALKEYQDLKLWDQKRAMELYSLIRRSTSR